MLYIPACPLTVANAEYMARQRDSFRRGIPAPDFPGGVGESLHVGRETVEELRARADIPKEALRAMGLEAWDIGGEMTEGEREVVGRANEVLGY